MTGTAVALRGVTKEFGTGDAKVTISAVDEEKQKRMQELVKKMRESKGAGGAKPDMTEMRNLSSSMNLVPTKYGDLNTSTLTATIKSGKNPDVNFDLKD